MSNAQEGALLNLMSSVWNQDSVLRDRTLMNAGQCQIFAKMDNVSIRWDHTDVSVTEASSQMGQLGALAALMWMSAGTGLGRVSMAVVTHMVPILVPVHQVTSSMLMERLVGIRMSAQQESTIANMNVLILKDHMSACVHWVTAS